MLKGKVISLNIGHKNGRTILVTNDKVTENDVDNFMDNVKKGHIELDAESKKLLKAKEKEAVEKAEKIQKEKDEARKKVAEANQDAQKVIKDQEKEIEDLKKQLKAKTDAESKVADQEKASKKPE